MIFPPQGYKNISYKWLNQGMIFRPHGSYSAGDVYTYWLAVVAHLHDLITRDSDKSKYTVEFKECICQIVNYWFSELIENKHAANIYLTTFVLNPGRTSFKFCFK